MQAEFNPIREARVFEGADALRRLDELGIPLETIVEALKAGDVAAGLADEYHPVTAAGTMRWFETVRVVRTGLAAHGWDSYETRNSPRSKSPDGTTALVAVSGNWKTGRADCEPSTANPRGRASSRAIDINQQLELNLELDLVGMALPDMGAEHDGSVRTWFLLYHRSASNGLRAEVSLPTAVRDKGVVDAWSERILLDPITFAAAVPIPHDAGEDDVEFGIEAV